MTGGKLQDQVCIVTGAASGIGRAIALSFAKAGGHVAAFDLNEAGLRETKALVEALGRRCGIYVGSVAARDAVERMVAEVVKDFGKINVCVNNAGIAKDGFLVKMTEESWDAVLNVNLKSCFLMTQAVAKAMQASNTPGSIINVSSIVGRCGNMGQANYAASKAGVIGFTKSVAREMTRFHIRVNAILPGFIVTPMTAAVPQKILDKMIEQIPMGRMGQPDEIAAAATFLASDDASFITGAQLEVTGGMWL